MKSILLEKANGIAKITLNRPKSFNSFNGEMALRLQANKVLMCLRVDVLKFNLNTSTP